jgi:hypothetical protein
MQAIKTNKHDIRMPIVLPFIDSIKMKFNIRIDTTNEQILLATYERYWILRDVVSTISGEEKKFLSELSNKYNSFIHSAI